MKVIRISDVMHEHLKKEAKREGRTLQWVVEDRLTEKSSEDEVRFPAPPPIRRVARQIPDYNDLPPVNMRTKGSILGDIDKQKLEIKKLEDETQVNQDPDLQELIAEEKDTLQGYWDEFNKFKAE